MLFPASPLTASTLLFIALCVDGVKTSDSLVKDVHRFTDLSKLREFVAPRKSGRVVVLGAFDATTGREKQAPASQKHERA